MPLEISLIAGSLCKPNFASESNGRHSATAMPFDWQNSANSGYGRYGCSPTWFTAVAAVVFVGRYSMFGIGKFGMPIALALYVFEHGMPLLQMPSSTAASFWYNQAVSVWQYPVRMASSVDLVPCSRSANQAPWPMTGISASV
ncbi:hypothetical protein DL89DRAFT_268104 [Linderina pennispora]|uniref:Uncharacterized protein n=1 Tax=Linderina pennispora TaxID=61395 RepID=A0A1Y1W6S5_9FUNG|nr:uncharacterized protein DL89DRAFT_268104 [Linderina pennispora]ORX69075.1 hypothetical protein DL89DRAFT_268104 [Linderina pennispora]